MKRSADRGTMRGTLTAFLQSCVILLVRADLWRLKESCELNRKVSDRKKSGEGEENGGLKTTLHAVFVSSSSLTSSSSFPFFVLFVSFSQSE